jgi:hypothetical protein
VRRSVFATYFMTNKSNSTVLLHKDTTIFAHRRKIAMTSLRNPLHRMCGRGVDSVSKPYRFSKANHHQKFPSLRGVRRSLTGWIMYPKPRPAFFAFPSGKDGMGLIEMPHSVQRTEEKSNSIILQINFVLT